MRLFRISYRFQYFVHIVSEMQCSHSFRNAMRHIVYCEQAVVRLATKLTVWWNSKVNLNLKSGLVKRRRAPCWCWSKRTVLRLGAVGGYFVVEDGGLWLDLSVVAAARHIDAGDPPLLQPLVEVHEEDVEHVHQQQNDRLVPVMATASRIKCLSVKGRC